MTRKKAIPRTPIGKRLQFARTVVAKLTQDELAGRSGVDRAAISRIESGYTVSPFPDTLRDLAEGLAVREDWLRGKGDTIRPGLYFVYLLTGRDGRALFVGVCANLPGQIDRHRRTSGWVREVARVDHLAVTGYDRAMAVRDQWVAQYIPVWNFQDSRTNLVRGEGAA